MRALSRTLYNSSRWLHIYLSTLLFSLLLFFCITGVVLNHIHWLDNTSEDKTIEQNLPVSWFSPQLTLEELQPKASKWLRKTYNLPQAKSIEFDHDTHEIFVDYSLPAGGALAIISLTDKQVSLDYQQAHWMNLWTDLHKGRHSGAIWSWIIDISAVLMVFFAMTGLIILFQNRKKRRSGLIAACIGTLSPVIIYYLFVPFVIA